MSDAHVRWVHKSYTHPDITGSVCFEHYKRRRQIENPPHWTLWQGFDAEPDSCPDCAERAEMSGPVPWRPTLYVPLRVQTAPLVQGALFGAIAVEPSVPACDHAGPSDQQLTLTGAVQSVCVRCGEVKS